MDVNIFVGIICCKLAGVGMTMTLWAITLHFYCSDNSFFMYFICTSKYVFFFWPVLNDEDRSKHSYPFSLCNSHSLLGYWHTDKEPPLCKQLSKHRSLSGVYGFAYVLGNIKLFHCGYKPVWGTVKGFLVYVVCECVSMCVRQSRHQLLDGYWMSSIDIGLKYQNIQPGSTASQ